MNAQPIPASTDPRDVPSYGINEAAHYLRLPKATLRSWVLGRYYDTDDGRKFWPPLVEIADRDGRLLSFMNLVEAHVLGAMRQGYEVPLPKARTAINYLKNKLAVAHPLATQRFETNGTDLFVSKYGQLINASQDGQLAMRDLLRAHLRRIEWDEEGLARRLFPFIRSRQADEPKFIVIDPRVSYGRPVLVGTGIATSVIAERYKAGESMDALANDYDRRRSEIEEAIRCELEVKAA